MPPTCQSLRQMGLICLTSQLCKVSITFPIIQVNKLRGQRASAELKQEPRVVCAERTLTLVAICMPPLLLFVQYLSLNNINNSNNSNNNS